MGEGSQDGDTALGGDGDGGVDAASEGDVDEGQEGGEESGEELLPVVAAVLLQAVEEEGEHLEQGVVGRQADQDVDKTRLQVNLSARQHRYGDNVTWWKQQDYAGRLQGIMGQSVFRRQFGSNGLK